MDIILYIAFGVLNIGLLYLATNLYRKETGFDLFPGRINGDKYEMFMCILSYFLCGPLGTFVLILFSTFLFAMWAKYYRKK